MRELMLFLEQHGVSANYAPKLQARYGGTALVFLMGMMGILLNISKYPKDMKNTE